MSINVLRSFKRLQRNTQQLRNISSFIGGGDEAQRCSTSRILPYESKELYKIIADIDNYSNFVPFCNHSLVTKRYPPDSLGVRWPAEADLSIGWMTIEEKFTSRIYCVPGSIVEALSGEAVTSLPKDMLLKSSSVIHSPALPNSLFKYLRSKWIIKPLSNNLTITDNKDFTRQLPSIKFQTQVDLILDFQFSNQLYTALSKAVTPKIVGSMIEAFEARAHNCIGHK
ncbi:Coenzyme Q-binding protein COQ10, mitochondrial [Golovinomyces cichoracearum]|uniref:Coenzyme Q-binding protein COQ10, mitochondrial n=1 Tax=Golovinomyces cichoracearum TaxID=62708 RepID=A0A420J102_9PEZI|nr:Coenzyme Q-binding protein COQ10, mitochondrial [Golovinomyces cichoracearum]